jgi:hypothetical protein
VTDTLRRERNTEMVRRFNAAMAEAGFPTRMFVGPVIAGSHMHTYDDGFSNAPPAIVWQALWLAKGNDPHPCWSCWEIANRADPLGPDHEQGRWASDCVTGRRGGCHFPSGPSNPPRDLLRGKGR